MLSAIFCCSARFCNQDFTRRILPKKVNNGTPIDIYQILKMLHLRNVGLLYYRFELFVVHSTKTLCAITLRGYKYVSSQLYESRKTDFKDRLQHRGRQIAEGLFSKSNLWHQIKAEPRLVLYNHDLLELVFNTNPNKRSFAVNLARLNFFSTNRTVIHLSLHWRYYDRIFLGINVF